jgi:hypothetical protein
MSAATAAGQPGSIPKFLDFLIAELRLKNDAALAREMDVAPPVVSKWRRNRLPFGPKHILRAHEHFGIGVAEIRDRAGLHH